MKKNQKLLNGVELFYKLALFGNRSSFLNRIAQLPSDKELAKGHQVPVENLSPLNDALKQKIQVPEILCTKELYFEEERVIKLSTVQNRGKKECRVPFKMNHPMTISVVA